jgi:hypothetical protein
MSKTFSQSDVASHNKPDNLWIIVDEDVYDLTQFQEEHPGQYTAPLQYYPSCISLLGRIMLTSNRWKEDPHESSGQGRIKTVLEVSQRGHIEEVPTSAQSRIIGHKETSYATYTSAITTSPEGGG